MPRDPRGQLVEKEFLTLPVWDRLDAGTAESVARAVERCLPKPWKFARVERHECGDQKRPVAYFTWKKVEFALIPGGEVTLGYDPKKPFDLGVAILANWKRAMRNVGVARPNWATYLCSHTSKRRQVALRHCSLLSSHGRGNRE